MDNEKQHIIFLRGIPASSKTTWVKAFLKQHRDYVVISRDGIREMLCDHSNSPQTESIVTKFYNKIFREALENKFNIILDNTHVRPSYISDALKLIESINPQANVELKQFDYDLETCIERDSKRDRVVGREVIEKMHGIMQQNPKRNIERLINEWKARVRSVPENLPEVEWDPNLTGCIICDLDGTLAHMDDRRGPFEWHKVGLDRLDKSVANVLHLYHKFSGVRVILVSARDSVCKPETIKWLNEHNIQYDDLFMRPEKDSRKDSIVKQEIYENNIKGKYNVLFVLDDRGQVVKLWRSLGLKCFQVQEGNF